jgi:hypothetical protein
MRFALALTLLACAPAFAQTCLPAKPTDSDNPHHWVQPAQNVAWHGTPMHGGVTTNGAYVRWACVNMTTREVRRVTYVGTVAEFSRAGTRLQTIMRATDPLKSLQTAGTRYTILPLTDPSLAAIVADVK